MGEFYRAEGIHLEIYDSVFGALADVDVYLRHAAETGGPVLDLGTGTGRIAWPLAEAGHDVIGLDMSQAMLRRARAKTGGRRPVFLRGDIAAFALGVRVPLVLIPFRTFEHLLQADAQRACLRRVRECLRPGGRVVLHVAGRTGGGSWAGRNPVTARALTVERTDARDQGGIVTEAWRFAEEGGRVELETLTYRPVPGLEMRARLAETGFASIRTEPLPGLPGRVWSAHVPAAGRTPSA